MNIVSVQHSFQEQSGLARDQIVNTFHFNKVTSGDGDMAGLATAIKDFFTGHEEVAGTSYPSLYDKYLGGSIFGTEAKIKMYKLTDAKPRPIVYQTSYTTPSATGADTVPTEVAMCLSYHSLPGSWGTETALAPALTANPVGRHRGRIYVGPVRSACLDTNGRPVQDFADMLRRLALRMYATAFALDFQWCIYSPTLTTQAGGVPQGSTIQAFSTDDAWDTQRRRGKQPTAKTTSLVP